jgi:hypothetical protein
LTVPVCGVSSPVSSSSLRSKLVILKRGILHAQIVFLPKNPL